MINNCLTGFCVMVSVEEVVRRFITKTKVDFQMKLNLNDAETREYIPRIRLVSNAVVFHDTDLRTAQYWGSCGTAATIVQLRHLHPRRIERLSAFKREGMFLNSAVSSNEYIDEISVREILGNPEEFLFDGAGGRPKIDQGWLFAETRNSIDKLERILTGGGSNLKLNRHQNFKNELELERTLMKVLSNNHLAYVSIDGAFRNGENYPFPKSAAEWHDRVSYAPSRPPRGPCRHWVIDFLEDIVKEVCEEPAQIHRESQYINHDNERCWELKKTIKRLEEMLGCPTHAITVTGVYEPARDYIDHHPDQPFRLFRVLDSNPGPRLEDSVHNKQGNRTRQGTVRYMTAIELWTHMREMGRKRILEWTTDKRGICGANKLQPLIVLRDEDVDLSDGSRFVRWVRETSYRPQSNGRI